MPLAYPISHEFTSFIGKTNTGKNKVFSVCNHCGFSDNIRDKDHINNISKGKLGSNRIRSKYYHLQECEIASQVIKDKYTKEGKIRSNQAAQRLLGESKNDQELQNRIRNDIINAGSNINNNNFNARHGGHGNVSNRGRQPNLNRFLILITTIIIITMITVMMGMKKH